MDCVSCPRTDTKSWITPVSMRCLNFCSNRQRRLKDTERRSSLIMSRARGFWCCAVRKSTLCIPGTCA